MPLAPSLAAGATVTVYADAANGQTTSGAAVAVVASAPVLSAVVTGTQIVVTWTAASPPANAVYQGELLDGGVVVATVAGTAGGAQFPLPAAGGRRYSVRGRLLAGVSQGPASGAVAVLTSTPSPMFGSLLDGQLNLEWNPSGDAGVTGYQVNCGAGGTVTAGSNTTFLTLPLASPGPAPGQITVAASGANTLGPAATVTIAPACTLTSGNYDGATLQVNLGGLPSPPPATLWVEVLSEGRVAARQAVGGTATAAAVPVALRPGTPTQVRVTGVGPGPLTLPSAPVALATTPPAGITGIYDGTWMHLAWTPVDDPGISGYWIQVNGANPAVACYVPGAASASHSVQAAIALPFATGVSVSVTATTRLSADTERLDGPANSTAPTLAGSLRAVAVNAANQPPYLYRRGVYATLAGVSGADLNAFLPNLFSGALAQPVTNAPFQLAASAIATPFPYQLTIDKSVWSSFNAQSTRPALRTAYRDFLKAVEQQGVQAWAIALLRQVIAAILPQTFDETLYYRHGVWRDDTLRIVDLDPGLRLRVAGELYQLVSGGAPSARNGFLASGQQNLDLVTAIPTGGGAPSLSVDAFLSALLPGGSQGTQVVAGGAIDFFANANSQSYYRLFYPKAFPSSGSTGSDQLVQNVAIIGAPNWAELEDLTDSYAQNGFFPTSGDFTALYFRGRAVLTPLAPVRVAGQTREVPLGTTARQLLATLGLAPWFGGGSGAVSLRRAVANLFDHPFATPILGYEPIDLSGTDLAALTPTVWPLDVPVLGGDLLDLTVDPLA